MSENTVAQLVKQYEKHYGEDVVHTGDEVLECPRFSTGILSLDLALGGGLPKGCSIQIFGKQDSGKSLLVYKIIATHQKEFPKEKCILVDIENNYDAVWAKKIGIDTKKLYVVTPEHIEQTIDIIEGLVHAEDVGLVVVDSVGAMIGQNELESEASKMKVGGNALQVSKMVRKLTVAQSKIRRTEGRYPSVIFINQVRVKIGVIYGSDEHLPGGTALQFAVNCSIRLYGKLIIDKAVNDSVPVKIETSATLTKYKFPIISRNAKYDIFTLEHAGNKVGSSYEWGTASRYLKDLNYLIKSGNTYWLFDKEYKTIKEIKERFITQIKFSTKVKEVITQTLLKVQQS